MSDDFPDLRDLASAYALGTLSPEEARAFEAALAESPELQRQVAEYREVNAILAMQDDLTPDPALKQRLLDRVRAGKTAPFPTPAAADPGRASRLPLLLWLGLAASVVAAAGLGLEVRRLGSVLRDRDSLLRQRETTLNSILEPNVQLVTLTATGEATPVVQVFWDRARHSLVLHSFRLPPAPQGRIYQLWLMQRDGGPIPSRTFDTEPDGHQLVERIEVPADLAINGFALTVEPAGGSPQPTSTPVVFGGVPGA